MLENFNVQSVSISITPCEVVDPSLHSYLLFVKIETAISLFSELTRSKILHLLIFR